VFNRTSARSSRAAGDAGYIPARALSPAARRAGAPGARRATAVRSRCPTADHGVVFEPATTVTSLIVASPAQLGAHALLTGGARQPCGPTPSSRTSIRRALSTTPPPALVLWANDGCDPGLSVLHNAPCPMVFTLRPYNLRRGRPVDKFRNAKFIAVYIGVCARRRGCPHGQRIFESARLLARAPLASDGSVRVRCVPDRRGFELAGRQAELGGQMGEEPSSASGEQISIGNRASLFLTRCAPAARLGDRHDVDSASAPMALTGAFASVSANASPVTIGPLPRATAACREPGLLPGTLARIHAVTVLLSSFTLGCPVVGVDNALISELGLVARRTPWLLRRVDVLSDPRALAAIAIAS